MAKQTTQAGAAKVAAPAPEAPRQTPETAAEAGLPQTQPDPEPAPLQAFDPEAYAKFLAEQPAELFEQAFEVMLAEARNRGIIGTEEDEAGPELVAQPAEEAEPSEEDAIRDLLKRNGLKQAWKDDAVNYHFDEKAATAAKATTVITAE